MFADHQPHIARSGRASPEGWRRVAIFALSTIKTPLEHAARDLPQNASGDLQTRTIFGFKPVGVRYLDKHAERLWSYCEHCCATLDGDELTDALVAAALEIPGIGLAKAGFIVQMIYGRSGCIDTHNLMRFNLPLRAFREIHPRSRSRTVMRKVRLYNETVEACGGTETLWNTWCEYAARVQPRGIYREASMADAISALHLAAC